MNPQDAIMMALTPGSPFNPKGLVFRTASSLCAFSGQSMDRVLDILAGDLSQIVTMKPSKKNPQVLMVARRDLAEELEKKKLAAKAAAPIKVIGGNIFAENPEPIMKGKEAMEAVAEMLDELDHDDEMDQDEDEESTPF